MPGLDYQQHGQQVLQLQQALIHSIKESNFHEAFRTADQILQVNPGNPLLQELRETLAEKLLLDEGQKDQSDDHDDSNLSDSDSDSTSEEEGSESEEDESEAKASTSSSEDEEEEEEEDSTSSAAPPTCDAVRESTSHALSADQRKQLRQALKEQLEDLKIQQAAEGMDIMGL